MTALLRAKLTHYGLTETIDEFLSEYRTTSAKTLAHYHANVARSLYDSLRLAGLHFIHEVEPRHIRAWLNAELGRPYEIKGVAKTIQPATVEGRRQAAARFFQWCIEQDYLTQNPVARVKPPRLPQRQIVGFDNTEVRRLLRYARGTRGRIDWIVKRDAAIITFLFDTGARASELMALTVDAIDWKRHQVILDGKGAKQRPVPLNDHTASALRAYL